MHSVLLVIEKPENAEHEGQQVWSALQAAIANGLNNVENAQDDHTAKRLGENIVLLPLAEHLSFFVTLTSLAQVSGFSYQVLFFEKEPQWVQYSPQQG